MSSLARVVRIESASFPITQANVYLIDWLVLAIYRTMSDEEAIATVRAELSRRFISGHGLEIGAGTRPFPLPRGANVSYGDIRDPVSLKSYFKTDAVQSGEPIDAQTLAGIADASLDFVISAHVIQHLRDPIGAIVNAIRILEHGGIHLLVVPDMRRTFDRDRPETSVAHVLADFSDGGIGTCRDGYEEHLRYVHPILTGQRYSEAKINARRPKRPGFGQSTALISTLGLKRDSRRCCMPRLTSFLSGLSTQLPS
jgi:SAM-dependent methyltransferase